MKTVINSSPLISLALIDQMELLTKIYDEVIVPNSVYNEVVLKGESKIGYDELKDCKFFTVLETGNKALKETIMLELDEGEAEVIALAKEKEINKVIIDEFAGRQYASLLGLKVIGTLGLLIVGKNLGFVSEVKPLMDIQLEVYFNNMLMREMN
jgi:predicted nucleic acid-binding protein